jgi:hypothetical protein
MNHKSPFLFSVLALAAAAVHAQQMEFVAGATPAGPQTAQVKYTLLKPQDKTAETVKDGERNPYGKSDGGLKTVDQKGTNEENDIRDRLLKLRVVGVSPDPQGLRVMLGDMVLVPGAFVPQVLPEQTVVLRVGSITPQAIELIWVEKKSSGLPARTMTIPVDLRPSVRIKLKGQPTEKNRWQKESSDDGEAAVTRLFPEVDQTPASAPTQMAQNTAVPRAVPVQEAGAAEQPPSSPPALSLKPVPQWEKVMSLLQRILPKEGSAP